MPSKKLTIYSFGYKGWGNATEKLKQAFDTVEKSRGFKPPVFADIRIRRSVRAEGFKERAFEDVVGRSRYVWIKDLGNDRIVTLSGPKVQIHNKAAVADLLNLAQDAMRDDRHLVFFCSCEWPHECHRHTVATLLLAYAKKHEVPIQVVEWPGGDPVKLQLPIAEEWIRKLARGTKFLPLDSVRPLAKYAGLAWGSFVTVKSAAQELYFTTGPARYRSTGWALPVFATAEPTSEGREYLAGYSEEFRRDLALYPLSV